MKQVDISDEHFDMLKKLTERYKTSPGNVVEMLIADRASVSDGHKNHLRRERALNTFLSDHPVDISHESAWRHGYKMGWLHFQMRHGTAHILLPIFNEKIDNY